MLRIGLRCMPEHDHIKADWSSCFWVPDAMTISKLQIIKTQVAFLMLHMLPFRTSRPQYIRMVVKEYENFNSRKAGL